jgi:HD-GYP domain-containing protein (c-di-GMP phosphodiesterase class II)
MKLPVRNSTNILVGLVIGLLLVLITWLAYLNGGPRGSYVHCYYVPIIIASYFLGDMGAVIAASSATLLSAVLPPSRGLAQWQPAQDIVIRGVFFYLIGLMTSRLFNKLQERRADAASLLTVSRTVNASLRATEVLRTITEIAVRITSAKACCIRLVNREGTEVIPAASYGLGLDYLARASARDAGHPVNREVLRGQMVAIPQLQHDPRFLEKEEARQEGLVSLLALPLQRGATVFGTLAVYAGTRHHWSRRECRMLEAFAEQAAVAIHNARLHEDLRRNYWETVSALARAIEAKDPLTLGHSERVTDYALQLGVACGLSAEEMETLRFAATLHDVGRIGVGDEVASRAGRVDVSDELVMRMHPLIGISILQPVEFLHPALAAVRSHHERWDGNGYPEGLAGEEIPRLARILAVADQYDRLLVEGSGRLVATTSGAAAELRRLAGTALDPHLVELFLGAVGREG